MSFYVPYMIPGEIALAFAIVVAASASEAACAMVRGCPAAIVVGYPSAAA